MSRRCCFSTCKICHIKMICMSSFRVSNLEAGGQHLQDVEDQEIGKASDPSYYTLKKSMKGKKKSTSREKVLRNTFAKRIKSQLLTRRNWTQMLLEAMHINMAWCERRVSLSGEVASLGWTDGSLASGSQEGNC